MTKMELYIKALQIGSCDCMTKTPVVEYHDKGCSYRKLENAIQTFEKWILSLKFGDTILVKNDQGEYIETTIHFAFIAYCQGLKGSGNERISLKIDERKGGDATQMADR